MKRLTFFAATLATLFLAGSCRQENLEPQVQGKSVTFTVEAPAAVQTRAIADGLNVDQLIYEVWLTETEDQKDLTSAVRLYQGKTDMNVVEKKNTAKVTVDLLQDQHYTVLFWAHVKEADAYDTEDLRKVTYRKDLSQYAANDESLAAFYAVSFITDGDPAEQTVTLTRPFAQLNLGTLNSKAENDGTYTIALDKSKVSVAQVPTVFNVATSEVSEPVTLSFALADVPAKTAGDEVLTVNETSYQYAGMNYVFAGDNVTVTYLITTKLNGTTEASVNNVVENVPLHENFRTNIIGNLLTSTTDYEIVVDADFTNPEIVIGEEWSQTGDYKYTVNEGASEGTLKDVLEHADAAAKAEATKAEGPVVTINLAEDVVWETGSGHGSTPLLPEDSPISAVVINGNGKTFTATGAGVGPIRLANGGQLTFNDVNVVDESVSYAEGSWEFTYLEFGGNLAFNGCTFNSGIQFEDAEVVADNCHFISNEDSVYSVWICGNNATFTKCTFEGTRGLKAHEAYGSEVASVVVDGCTFKQLTKKPGIALGDLNAETSVTIKNSTFDRCQAGDQENYMYETDTDVATFTFVTENNTIVPSGDHAIEQEDGSVIVATTPGFATAIANAEDGAVIRVAGEVVLPNGLNNAKSGSLTIVGMGEDSKVAFNSVPGGADGGLNCYADGMDLYFKDIKIVSPNTGSAYSGGFGRAKSVTFENCEYIGQYRAGSAYTKFIGCNIDPQNSYIYTDSANVDFMDCTFNCSEGKGIQVYNDGNTSKTVVNVTDCEFTAAKHGATWDGKPVTAIDINSNGETFEVNITNTTATGFPSGLVSGETLFNIKGGAEYITVNVDGKRFVSAGVWIDAGGNYTVTSAAGLTYVAANASEGTTNVIIAKDIEGNATIVQKPGVKLVVNGQSKNYNGMITVDGKSATYTTAGLTINDLNFNAASIDGDACIRLGDGTDATRYTCNVTVNNCTFDVPGAVGVKSYTGGDKNLTVTGCTATANAHSLVQVAGVDDVRIENCKLYSKNGMNFNQSTNVVIDECTADVKGYAARFGAGSGNTGAAEVYEIKNSTLKSACEDGDAVIILRGTADYSTLTITNTTLVGTTQIANNAKDAKVYIDGACTVTTADGLKAALAAKAENIVLMPGIFEGTFQPLVATNIKSYGTEKAEIAGRVNIKSVSVLFKNIKFSVTDDSKVKWTTGSNLTKTYPSIVMAEGNSDVVTFENCDFELTTEASAYSNATSGKGIFDGCAFNGAYRYPIYSRANIEVKDCVYSTTLTEVLAGANLSALANGKVVFENNTLTNSSEINLSTAILFLSTNNTNQVWKGPVEFTVKNNAGFEYSYQKAGNFAVNSEDHTFTEGSDSF